MNKHINILFTSGHTLELENVISVKNTNGIMEFRHESGNMTWINANNINFIRLIEVN